MYSRLHGGQKNIDTKWEWHKLSLGYNKMRSFSWNFWEWATFSRVNDLISEFHVWCCSSCSLKNMSWRVLIVKISQHIEVDNAWRASEWSVKHARTFRIADYANSNIENWLTFKVYFHMNYSEKHKVAQISNCVICKFPNLHQVINLQVPEGNDKFNVFA